MAITLVNFDLSWLNSPRLLFWYPSWSKFNAWKIQTNLLRCWLGVLKFRGNSWFEYDWKLKPTCDIVMFTFFNKLWVRWNRVFENWSLWIFIFGLIQVAKKLKVCIIAHLDKKSIWVETYISITVFAFLSLCFVFSCLINI